MSLITDTISKGLPWEDLRAFLVTYPYATPERDREVKRTAAAIEVADPTYHDDGTWDEVRRARNFGLITNDQYLEVARALGSLGASAYLTRLELRAGDV